MSSLRPYELLVIIDPRQTDEEAGSVLNQLADTLKSLGADVTKIDNWGRRRLAYDIRKQREGTYAVLEVAAEPTMVREFERQMRLNEAVLRFLSTSVPVRKRRRARTEATPEPAREPAAAEESAKPATAEAGTTTETVVEEVR